MRFLNNVLMPLAMVICVAYFFLSVVKVQNGVGHILGFGTCPACHDSWWWKSHGTLGYAEGAGVMICNECLQRKTLPVSTIVGSLIEYDWPLEKALRVGEQVREFNNGRRDGVWPR